MKGAASNKGSTGRRKARFFITSIVAVLLLGMATYIYAFERGPFVCNNGCTVQSPLIDAATAAYLDSILAPVDRVPMAMYASGTTYIICNTTHCTTYRQTFSGEYAGDDRKQIEPTPPPTGNGGCSGSCNPGNGGGSSSGGGGTPGGGGTGGGGVVTVGPPTNED